MHYAHAVPYSRVECHNFTPEVNWRTSKWSKCDKNKKGENICPNNSLNN